MSHDTDEAVSVSQLRDIVQQLSSKVEQLEAAITSITTGSGNRARSNTSSHPRSSTLANLARLNDETLPSMNMDAFLNYLTCMPYDVENVVDKKSAEVLAEIVINGHRSLCAQHSNNSTKFIAPIASVSVNNSTGTLCLFDSTESKWIICTPEMFSLFARRVHACVVTQYNHWREKNMGPPRPRYTTTTSSATTSPGSSDGSEPEPNPVRDPRIMAKNHKITAKIYSLNLGSAGLMARTKKLVGAACVLRLS